MEQLAVVVSRVRRAADRDRAARRAGEPRGDRHALARRRAAAVRRAASATCASPTSPTALTRLRDEHGVRSIDCEGGPRLNGSLIPAGLVDELHLVIARQARRRPRPADRLQRARSAGRAQPALTARVGRLPVPALRARRVRRPAPATPATAALARLRGRRRRAARRLLVNSWVSQMEHLWTEPRLARMFARLTSFARLVQFDRRGSGMSDRVPPAPLEEQMDDVLAVLDAAGCERPAVLAETEGTRSPACSRPPTPSACARWRCSRRSRASCPRPTTRGRTTRCGASRTSRTASSTGARA